MADPTREDPSEVFNHDVVILHDMCNRFIIECYKSQSHGVSGMIQHDQVRMGSYIGSLRKLKGWVVTQPLLDLPETHPRPFPLEAKPVVQNVESEACNHFIRMLEAARTELIHSQSARLASSLLPHDAQRFDWIMNKMEKFLEDYVEPATPIDLPESSPGEALAGHGSSGVNPR